MKYSMTEEERGQAFPIHIEMGEDGPVLDLGKRADVVNLPDTGCILVDYEKNEDGTLKIKTVCLPADESDESPDDLDDALGNEPKEMDEEDQEDNE